MYGFQISIGGHGASYELAPCPITQPVREADMSKKVYYDTVLDMPRAEMPKHGRFKDLTGKKFGRLTVVQFVGTDKNHKALWGCQCACGELVMILGRTLENGHTTSCGCFQREATAQRSRTHGKCTTRLYRVWTGILKRCNNPKSRSYSNYGGRGISCEFGSFEEFDKYVNTNLGVRPSSKYSLDRINNGGNYAPGNLRWATQSEQGRNKSNNHLVTWEGREMFLVEACELAGRPYSAVFSRILRYGWTMEKALTTPVRPRRYKPPLAQALPQ